MSNGQVELPLIGECGQSGFWVAQRGLHATLQAPVGFIKVSSDKAKVFIKPGTRGASTVVAVEARLLNTSTQGALSTGG